MNIKPSDKTIMQLLKSGKQFVIPRFQREYSWEKRNYMEFIEDMIDNLIIENGVIKHDQYFLGTMLFIGDIAEGSYSEISVVDGQQRLTTITILFSALSNLFISINENGLSLRLFEYVMTKDNDDNDVRILKSKSHYPFFAYFIQDREKTIDTRPNSDEEICIKETYDYFADVLQENKLRNLLEKNHGKEVVEAVAYVDILKAIRDQVLNSTIVAITTTDKDQANKIFEILNAKGKRLAHIDLIKNKVFDILSTTEPADFAEETWSSIRKTLSSGKESIGFATFYRHFWISKYKKSSSTKLYDDFLKHKISKNPARCRSFLDEMLINAKYYMQIINPNLENYENRKEYAWLVQSLKNLIVDFNIVQVRIALLALFDIKSRDLISTKKFKNTVIYLEKFHYAYNTVLALRPNKLEKIYSAFAISLRDCKSKDESNQIIDTKLIQPLERIYPDEATFCDMFSKMYYSKKETSSNIKTKYAINMLNCYYSEKELFEIDGSIEHLSPESNGEKALNIGNLILLELEINNQAGQTVYEEKKDRYYKSSQYKWVQSFIEKHPDWNESMIEDRATMMAETFYRFVLQRN